MVCRLALHIARALINAGADLNIEEIEAAALLHDITKTRSLETGENHALTGGKLLRELGYERIAKIVEEHIHPGRGGSAVTAEEIVSYADKRVLHDSVVSLDERFDYLVNRYGCNALALDRIRAAKLRAEEIEKKLLSKVDDLHTYNL